MNKMKKQKKSVGTLPKFNRKIIEAGHKINIPNTHLHDRSLNYICVKLMP